MTDANDDLIARIAHRPPAGEEYHAWQRANEAPTVYSSLPPTAAVVVDWNTPVDMILADAMTNRQLIRGEVAEAKLRARRWDPGWPPDDWPTD